jgi:hypothetical protein
VSTGPNAASAIQDQADDTVTDDQQGQQDPATEPNEHWWNRWRQIF